MVSIWLMKVKGAKELSSTQKIGLPGEGRFSENCWYLVPRTQRSAPFFTAWCAAEPGP
jgi:hypothetical protein